MWDKQSALRWSAESYGEALDAYSGVAYNSSVPLQYILKNQQLALRKLALAGYRLANILDYLYRLEA